MCCALVALSNFLFFSFKILILNGILKAIILPPVQPTELTSWQNWQEILNINTPKKDNVTSRTTSCMFAFENVQFLSDSGGSEKRPLMKSQENYPDSGCWWCMLDESLHATIQFISSGSYGTIKSSVPIIQCSVCSNDSQFSAVWTQKPPNSRNTSTLLFTLFWNWKIKLDRFCPEPQLVLFHRYLWPSHLGSFWLPLPLAVRTRPRAATTQPNDWQLVVTDCSVYSSIFCPTTAFDVVGVFFCFKVKLYSKV